MPCSCESIAAAIEAGAEVTNGQSIHDAQMMYTFTEGVFVRESRFNTANDECTTETCGLFWDAIAALEARILGL